jgi:hypothetical protein
VVRNIRGINPMAEFVILGDFNGSRISDMAVNHAHSSDVFGEPRFVKNIAVLNPVKMKCS